MSMARLVDGVYADRAAAAAADLLDQPAIDEDTRSTAEQVVATCERIGHEVAATRAQILDLLADDGLDATPVVEDRPQRHALRFQVGDPATAERVAERLAGEGFEPWDVWRAGARESFLRSADHLTVARTDGVTTVVRVAWREHAPRTRMERLVRPTAGDWTMVTLPRRAWWGYPAVRMARLALERSGRRPRHESGLGPFLATPESLLTPLLRVADVGLDDTVLDLGCGDGRLPVAAAVAGCRAIGVERSDELVRRARARAAAAGVADRVTILAGDARAADLDDADVVFAFLPADVLAQLLPSTLTSMRSGARLVAHEQHRLPASVDPAPDASRVIVGVDGLTVAHRWSA